MASTLRQTNQPVAAAFPPAALTEFFQLVRRLHHANYQVSFAGSSSFAYPVGDVEKYELNHVERKARVLTQFLGFVGQSGILPLHYTEYVVARMQAKDPTLLVFLDIFHDQLLHLFYEVGSLSHFYQELEQGKAEPISQLLGVLTGVEHSEFVDLYRYFSGVTNFSMRNAQGLQQMLSFYFNLPIRVEQFKPKWYLLASSEKTKLTRKKHNNILGKTAIIGEKVWNITQRFTIIIGPVDYQQFLTLLPGTPFLQCFNQLVGTYTYHELEYDLVFWVQATTLPICTVGRTQLAKLGWNTYLTRQHQSGELVQIKLSANRINHQNRNNDATPH
jgi:type VI secretion system protein ImpH